MEHAPAWLINCLIYLGAAVLAVPLSQALGLGSIIGYLAAGIADRPLGPGAGHQRRGHPALRRVRRGADAVPGRPRARAAAPVVLRRPIFGWGSAQVLGSRRAAVRWRGWPAGVDWRVALVAALGLALSSTAIGLQVLAERNLLPHRPAGQAGFSILLFQDVAAIPILALLPLLAAAPRRQRDGRRRPAGSRRCKIVGVIGGIVLGGRLLLRPAAALDRAQQARPRSSPPPRCCWWSRSRR